MPSIRVFPKHELDQPWQVCWLVAHFLKDGLEGRVVHHFLVHVLVVYVVSDSDKLLGLVRAGEQDHGHTHHILRWDLVVIWAISLGIQTRTQRESPISKSWNVHTLLSKFAIKLSEKIPPLKCKYTASNVCIALPDMWHHYARNLCY